MKKVVKSTIIAVLLLCTLLSFACFAACDIGKSSKNPTDSPQQEHTCSFVLEKAEGKYLKSDATCTTKAVYYKSCSCGKASETETFETGMLKEHSYTNKECSVCGKKQPSEGLAFTLNKEGTEYSVTGMGDCLDTELVISETYNGLPVTSIGDFAFYDCNSLTSVTIGNSVTSIGIGAFEYCYKLVEVINKSKLTITKGSSDNGYIGYYALNVKKDGESEVVKTADGYLFYTYDNVNYLLDYVGDKTSLTLPENYNGQNYEINKTAFKSCKSLVSVKIPDSVTNIENDAFSGCTSLTSVTIGNAVTSIGKSAFEWCSSLTEINYNATECADLSFSNYVFSYAGQDGTGIKVTIGKNVKKIPTYLFCPGGLWDSPKITEVVFEEDSACNSIGNYAFKYCKSLTSITIGESVTSIGDDAFSDCSSIENIYYNEDINDWVQIEGLYDLMYYGKSSKNLYINGELLTEANITTATKINGYAFYNYSSLTSVTIGNGVTSIGYDVFYGCSSLVSVTIPNSVKSIGGHAFQNCSSLASITISDSVTSIGDYAFSGCNSLMNVTFENPNGWYVCYYSTATSGTNLTLTDAAKNAEYLTSTYRDYYWKRTVEQSAD